MTTPAPEAEYLPPATPATPDLICWLRAAVPPKDGRLQVKRTANVLGVSETSIRRWVKDAHDRELNQTALRILRRYAILRGHGDYLWPPLDDVSVRRAELLAHKAERSSFIARTAPDTVAHDPKSTQRSTVLLYHAPDAKVIGVATGDARERRRKLTAAGCVILDEVEVENYWAAQVLKHQVLNLMEPWLCIPPRSLLPTGRTEVWLHRGGMPDMHDVAQAPARASHPV